MRISCLLDSSFASHRLLRERNTGSGTTPLAFRVQSSDHKSENRTTFSVTPRLALLPR